MATPEEKDVWSKLFELERDILVNQKSIDKLDSSYDDLIKKIDKIKDDIRNQRGIDTIEEKLELAGKQLDTLRQEMPELRLIKKLFFALLMFVLTAFLGLIWNTVVLNAPKPMHNTELSEISKKIINEYKKGQ